MKMRMKLVALLAYLMAAMTGMGTSIQLLGGSNSAVASPGGSVSGGAFVSTDVMNDDELGFTTGIIANVLIPEDVMGYAYSHWSKGRDTPKTLSASGGNSYLLDTGYNGVVKVGAKKTSSDGVASSSAQLSSKVYANGETGSLSGTATVEAATSNTGSGDTYAIASGSASYGVLQTESFSVWGPVEEVYGEARGTVKLISSNYGGKVSGKGHIITSSQADVTSSTSTSSMGTSMSASMKDRGGKSFVDGSVEGGAWSGAWDESTFDIIDKERGTNENVFSQVSGNLYGTSDAYTSGDRSALSGDLSSKAINIFEGSGYHEAQSTGSTRSSVVRKDSGKTAASAKAVISEGSLYAVSRDSIVSPAITFAESKAESVDMSTVINARSAWSGDNSVSETIRSLYDARDGSGEYLADISSQVVNHGPVNTGDLGDSSVAEDHVHGLWANAQDGYDATSVHLAGKYLLSAITGKEGTTGRKTIMKRVSTPIFDAHCGSEHTVIGPVVTSPATQNQDTSIISYKARSSYSQ